MCEHPLWLRYILVGLKVSPEVNLFLTTVKLRASAFVATGFSSAKTIKGLKISPLLSSVRTLSANSVWLGETLRCSCLTCVILLAEGWPYMVKRSLRRGSPGLTKETSVSKLALQGSPQKDGLRVPSPQPPAPSRLATFQEGTV